MQKEQKQAISDLADLLHQKNLSEIEFEENGVYIRLVGPKSEAPAASQAVAPAPALPVVQPEASKALVKKEEETLKSPMVGVVYLAKDPKSPAFVKPGDKVVPGQTVCLIEAMKTYNPIKALKAGVVREVLVENGEPVEYDQPLFVLE